MEEITRIGILGGGQLALMLAESEQTSKLSFLSSDKEGSCAFEVAKAFTKDLSDPKNIDDFCNQVDVVTFDSEFLGVDYADAIKSRGLNVYPSKDFVSMSGDRLAEKTEINRLGIPTAYFISVDEDIEEKELFSLLLSLVEENKLSNLGIVVKTRHGGYDGKGQWVLQKKNCESDFSQVAAEVIAMVTSPGLIIEGLVDFDFECSIIASRSTSGEIVTWPLVHNIHKDSILDLSRSPIDSSMINENETQAAIEIVNKLCSEHNYVGTICVELFHTQDGLVVNEIAPRVHNSGHLTIEGSKTSQFKNHINSIRGVKLGSTELKGFCAMINIVGFEPNERTKEIVDSKDNVFLHWYGKEVKPKRKVGHITIVSESREDLENTILQIKGTF